MNRKVKKRSVVVDICNQMVGSERFYSMRDILALPCTVDYRGVCYYKLDSELMLGIDPVIRFGILERHFASSVMADSVVVRLNMRDEIIGYKICAIDEAYESASMIVIAGSEFALSTTVDIFINSRNNHVRLSNVRFSGFKDVVLGDATFKMPDIMPIITSYKIYGELLNLVYGTETAYSIRTLTYDVNDITHKGQIFLSHADHGLGNATPVILNMPVICNTQQE